MNTLTPISSPHSQTGVVTNILSTLRNTALGVTLACGLAGCGENPEKASVRELQNLLQSVGAYSEKIDGDFGRFTKAGIILVQTYCGEKFASEDVGKDSPKLRTLLQSLQSRGQTLTHCPGYEQPLPDIFMVELKNTTKNISSSDLQSWLMNMRAFQGEIDGIIGKETLKAAARYQTHCPKPDMQVGILDTKTVEHIQEDFQKGNTIYTCQHTL